jgi:PRTRC genetic system protein B
MTTEPIKRPWRDRSRAARRPDVVVTNGTPLAQITIYEQLTLLTRRNGPTWRQYPISPDALARVLGSVPSASGLLPPHTLGTGHVAGAPFYVVYVPPHTRTLRLAGNGTGASQAYTLPLPPLVWAGHGTDYRIWALDTPDRPSNTHTPLMRAPFPNVFADGRICWGSSESAPPASPASLDRVLTLFLEQSNFNLHLANGKSVAFPNSVVAHWQHLIEGGDEAYPLDDLMPAEYALGWVLAGSPWGAR